ncbi:MAG: nitrogen fixation protein NifQ [Magnetococcus sp. YQC-3]
MEYCADLLPVGRSRPPRQFGLYSVLSGAARYSPTGEWLARIISSWLAGETVLPAHLGLGRPALLDLLGYHFPGIVLPDDYPRGCATIDASRAPEREALLELFLDNSSLRAPDAHWLAQIVAAGCLGEDHLWQDLGLWSRNDLSSLLLYGFAPLARRNVRDMKWKKFFYKQLCEAAEIPLCRAPSCEACRDYAGCFGPEE